MPTPQPSHPTPCLPHRGTLLESKFEILSRLNRARARLWGQVSPMAHETPHPRPRPFPPGPAPGPRLQQARRRSPCSGFHSAQTRPTARRFPGRSSPVSTCGWGACGPAPATAPHRCSDPPSPPKGPRPLSWRLGARPARHHHSGNKTERPPDLGAGQDPTAAEEEGGSRVTNPRPGAQARAASAH